MRKLIVPSALLLACALTGCAPLEFEQASPTAPALSPSEQSETEIKRSDAVKGQHWADDLMNAYWLREDSYTIEGITEPQPARIMAWGASKPGELILTLNDYGSVTDDQLKNFALRMLEEFDAPSLKSVTVTILGRDISAVARVEELYVSQA